VKQPPRRLVDYRRLARRNLPGLLRYKFLHEYGYDKGPIVVQAIVADICETVRRYYRRQADLEPGELIYLAPANGEGGGRGKTMGKTKLLPVRLTIVADEDIEAIRQGLPTADRRTIRVRRLARQAHAQGALLSQRDIALVAGFSPGAVSMTTVALRKQGEFLPLRGYVMDMGSFPTHKAAVIRLYLQGMLTPDIASRTYHSKEAVDRYIRGFERVRLLASKFSKEELPLLTGMSELLVEQYLQLLSDHATEERKPHAAASTT
jgi:uncharacterized protein DUF1670